MTIWRPSSIEEAPVVALEAWGVFQTEKGERHLFGRNMADYSGRVSQAIGMFDPATMTVRSSSGRVYVLQGPPGWSRDAEYVKNRWLNINNVVEYTDVTDDYWTFPSW